MGIRQGNAVEAMFCVRTKLAFNAPKDGRGIGQSSTDVLGMYIG